MAELDAQLAAINALLERVGIFIWYAGDLDASGNLTEPVTFLDLGETPIDDEALSCLRHFTELEWLCLEGTAITDAAIEHLKLLTSLEHLEVRGTNISKTGIEELGRSLPGCQIDGGD